MKDFLGNEYDVGDKVLYAAMSGRSVTIVLAEVVEIYQRQKTDYDGKPYGDPETKVQVQPLNSSRWKQHYGHDYYVDTRSGKRIDVWRSDKHIERHGHYRHKVTGETSGDRPMGEGWQDWEYVSTEFKPYVEKRHDGPKPVTISVTDNIVLWQGKTETNESHPEWKACK